MSGLRSAEGLDLKENGEALTRALRRTSYESAEVGARAVERSGCKVALHCRCSGNKQQLPVGRRLDEEFERQSSKVHRQKRKDSERYLVDGDVKMCRGGNSKDACDRQRYNAVTQRPINDESTADLHIT